MGLEGTSGVFVAAGEADEVTEVAVEFGGGEVGVGFWVEGVDVFA